MIGSSNKNGYKWLMLASMLLLSSFLTYFVYTAFEKERETILTEKREKIFKDAFSWIDGINEKQKIGEDTNSINSQLDTTTRSFHLTTESHTDSSSITFAEEFKEPSEKVSSTIFSDFDKEAPLAKKLDSVSMIIKKVSTTENLIIEDFDSNGELGDAKLGIMKITDEDGKVSLAVSGIEVSQWDVVKRIIPQILFSILLLAIVGSSFWLVSRSLTKERELTLLRNDLLSNMSHELKTPISTVGVALEALSNFDAANDPKLRKEYIDISRSEVKRLGLLVDKALNLSLFEQGKFVYEKQNIDLDEEIALILKTLKVQLDTNQVKIDYSKTGNRFFVSVDRTHMINVIHNLIENAIKYSKQPTEIDINLKEVNEQIEISVADNGIGIPKEYQSKVFDKFFRVPHGNKHNTKGHGLGLSYVKEVIKNQGGNIRFTSSEGIGTTFILNIPKI